MPPLDLSQFTAQPANGNQGAGGNAGNNVAPSPAPLNLNNFKVGSPAPAPLTADAKTTQELDSGALNGDGTRGQAPNAYAKATAALQDVGNAAGDASNALTSSWSPLGWVTRGIGGAADLVAKGLDVTVNPVVEKGAAAVGGAIRNVVGAKNIDAGVQAVKNAANSPLAQSLKKTFTAPDVTGDLGAVGNIANVAGTVAALPAAGEGLSALSKAGDLNGIAEGLSDNATAGLRQKAVQSAQEDWEKPTTVTKPTYNKATQIASNAAAKGTNVPEVLAKNGIRLSDNIDGQNYSTTDTADKIRADAGKASAELLRPSLQMADYTTPKIPVSDLVKSTVEDIRNSKGITPGDMEAQAQKAKAEGDALERKYPDGMSLTDMHDEKINYAGNGKYSPVGDTNVNNTAAVNRSFGRTLAGSVESTAPKGIPVHEFNAELQKQYQAADYLDALNGKRVPNSVLSRIANTAGKVVGAKVGSVLGGGILGGVGGYHIGGMVESMLEGMTNSTRGHFLNTLEMTNPDAFEALRDYIGTEKTAMYQRRLLPAPSPLGSPKNPIITPAPTTYEKGISPTKLPNQ